MSSVATLTLKLLNLATTKQADAFADQIATLHRGADRFMSTVGDEFKTVNALGGAGVGGITGAITGALIPSTDAEGNTHHLRNALGGTLMGAAGGWLGGRAMNWPATSIGGGFIHRAINRLTPASLEGPEGETEARNSIYKALATMPTMALGAGGALGGFMASQTRDAHTAEEKKNKFKRSLLAALGGGVAGINVAGLLTRNMAEGIKAGSVDAPMLGGEPLVLRKSQVRRLRNIDEEQNSAKRLIQDTILRTPTMVLSGQALRSIANRLNPHENVGATVGAAAGANIGSAGTAALLAHIERASGKPLSFIQRAIPTLAATGLLAGGGGLLGQYIDRNNLPKPIL